MRIVFCLHFSRGVHDYRPTGTDIPLAPDCAHEKVGSFRAKVHDFSAKQGHILRKVALFF